MNIRRLRRELGDGVKVTRDRKKELTTVRGGGLEYRIDEREFVNERELATYAKSKMTVTKIKTP